MTTLRHTQLAFQAYVLGARDGPGTEVVGDARAGRRRRMDVYAEAYRLRLIEALATDYPALQGRLGDEAFERLCRRYIDACPSRHASVRWFGEHLSRFLKAQPPWVDWPHLAELAAFEWLQSEVFDAGDASLLSPDELAALPAEHWPELIVTLHPAVRLTRYRFNTPQLWQHALEGTAAHPVPGASRWLLWRYRLDIHWRSVPEDEWWALGQARAGVSFAALCEGLCQWQGPERAAGRAAGLLKRWLLDGLVSGGR